jgi:hypothetical protein
MIIQEPEALQQQAVTCPSPQPDGARMPEGVCAREASPESQIAVQLGRYSTCQELGYCARAYAITLFNSAIQCWRYNILKRYPSGLVNREL